MHGSSEAMTYNQADQLVGHICKRAGDFRDKYSGGLEVFPEYPMVFECYRNERRIGKPRNETYHLIEPTGRYIMLDVRT